MSNEMTPYQERSNRIFKTINLEQADRVPVLGTYGTWCAYYAGYTPAQVDIDLDKCAKAIAKVATDIPVDMLHMVSNNPAALLQSLGSKNYNYLSKDNIIQYSDEQAGIMSGDEYPEFNKDPLRFIVEKILPRKFAELAKSSPAKDVALARGAMHFAIYGAKSGGITGALAQQGMPLLGDGVLMHPIDLIADMYRGIKGMFGDMRRRPEVVLEAIEALLPVILRFGMGQVHMAPPKATPKVLFLPMHLPTMMKLADFDKFYWPAFKKMMDFFAAQNVCVLGFYEGDWSRYYDHLQELSAKKSFGWFEHANFKEIKQSLKDTMCIVGLFPATLLQYGTEQECIAKAKEILDIMAPGGGYIFATDRELIAAQDGKSKNIIAVNKFVMEYGIY
ncbi:uroporphyrinogen decarboxylase family protein [Dehalobacter sp. 4CP]|uniref:uroporphyrinogen decarboxylase family protein n=1 Tax=Dehalobacter sp. CP TaxID=2594474 RepID=UPI0039EB9E28|nr:uroporphyrinogen decarboxylase [Dehalobacter sp.]